MRQQFTPGIIMVCLSSFRRQHSKLFINTPPPPRQWASWAHCFRGSMESTGHSAAACTGARGPPLAIQRLLELQPLPLSKGQSFKGWRAEPPPPGGDTECTSLQQVPVSRTLPDFKRLKTARRRHDDGQTGHQSLETISLVAEHWSHWAKLGQTGLPGRRTAYHQGHRTESGPRPRGGHTHTHTQLH